MSYGFTLAELLIVIAMLLLLSITAAPFYTRLYSGAQIDDASSQLVQNLRTGQERASGQFNDSAHGVYFDIMPNDLDGYVLYQGGSYVARNQEFDRTITLDEAFSLSTTLSGDDVTFSKGLGVPSEVGTITITHTNGETVDIILNEKGGVRISEN